MRLANLVPKGWDDDEMFMAGHEEREPMAVNPIMYSTTLNYFFRGKNLIDFVAILPFYISLIFWKMSPSFIRALRLLGYACF